MLTLFCVLVLVSCDGGGGGNGVSVANSQSVANNDVRGDNAVALTSLFSGERIEYYELGSTTVRDSLEFADTNITSTTNRFAKVYVYNNDVGRDIDFQVQATGDANETQLERIERIVLSLIQGPDSNVDFIAWIRGDVSRDFAELEDILNTQGANVELRGGDLFALNGPVFYDHTIDSTLNAQFVAGVIEGIYKLYTVERKITFRDATDEERAILETEGSNLEYAIPQITDDSDNLVNLIADGSATLEVANARFKIFLQADNTGR